jgi:integrase
MKNFTYLVSELEALRWSDITMSERKGNLIVRSGKGGKRREIPLNPDARSALLLLGWDEHQAR